MWWWWSGDDNNNNKILIILIVTFAKYSSKNTIFYRSNFKMFISWKILYAKQEVIQ